MASATVFISPHCTFCHRLLRENRGFLKTHGIRVVDLTAGPHPDAKNVSAVPTTIIQGAHGTKWIKFEGYPGVHKWTQQVLAYLAAPEPGVSHLAAKPPGSSRGMPLRNWL